MGNPAWPAEKPRGEGESIKRSQWGRNTMKTGKHALVRMWLGVTMSQSKYLIDTPTKQLFSLLILYCY